MKLEKIPYWLIAVVSYVLAIGLSETKITALIVIVDLVFLISSIIAISKIRIEVAISRRLALLGLCAFLVLWGFASIVGGVLSVAQSKPAAQISVSSQLEALGFMNIFLAVFCYSRLQRRAQAKEIETSAYLKRKGELAAEKEAGK